MALTQISTGGVKDDAVTAGKIPAGAVGSSEIAKPIDLADNEKIRFGTGNDLEIYHDGTRTIFDAATSKNIDFYYNGTQQFWFGNNEFKGKDNNKIILGNGDDLKIYHDGSDSYIKDAGTGQLHIHTNEFRLQNAAGNEQQIATNENGDVQLFYDGSKKLETQANGITVSGGGIFSGNIETSEHVNLTADNKRIKIGAGEDLQIYHDGSNYIVSDTTLFLHGDGTNSIYIRPKSDEHSAIFRPNGSIELYYDNSKKFETTSSGVTVTGTVSDSKGNLRSIPRNGQGSAYTLVASDAGKAVGCVSTITVPNGVFSVGDAVTIMNEHSSADITIAQGSGLTLWNATAGSNSAGGDRTLGVRGICTLYFPSSSQAYISGAGLS